MAKQISSRRNNAASGAIERGEPGGLLSVLACNPELDALLGAPALLPDEDATAFANFYLKVRTSIGPCSILEEMFVSDVVESNWEIVRFRRWKTQLLMSYAPRELERLLSPALSDPQVRANLVSAWVAGDTSAFERVRDLLARIGLEPHAVHARAFASYLGEYEAIERMLIGATKRRNEALRQIEHRRELHARVVAATDADHLDAASA